MQDIQSYYNPVDISVKEIINIAHSIRQKNFQFKRTDCRNFRLAYVISGSAVYDFGDQEITVVPGDVLFIGNNNGYTCKVADEGAWEHMVITFTLWDAERVDILPLQFVNKSSRPKQFEDLFKEAFRVYNSGSAACNMEAKALVYLIISKLLQENEKQFFKKSKYKGIKDVAEYIKSNYKEKITMDDLVQISGYSISHFSRLFKELYGLSPVDYINYIRIDNAKKLLRSDMLTLSEIAEECGFSNAYYFSRVFKMKTNMTPREYLNSVAK